MKIIEQSARFVWSTPLSTIQIESAGRVAYKSEGMMTAESASKFVSGIIDKGHGSVLEHASASFHIITDRGVSHEIVRHRLASYTQESTRYCNYGKEKFGKEISVIRPIGLTENTERIWARSMAEAEDAYLRMLQEGASPQIARSVLPHSLKTEIRMTCNFREWRHFLKTRCAKDAHPQMRALAYDILHDLNLVAPIVFPRSLAPDMGQELRDAQ